MEDVQAPGAALQIAWLGSTATRHVITETSRAHMVRGSCTLMVRRVLFAAGRALSLRDLRQATGHADHDIGSCLAKLMQKGLVRKLPPPDGRPRGARYRWASDQAPPAHAWFG